MPKSPVVRFAREVYGHAESLYGSLAVSLLLLALDKWAGLQVPAWVYIIMVAAGLTVAQYRAWLAVNEKLRTHLATDAKEAMRAEFDLKFGSSANLSPVRRFEAAVAKLEELEKAVYSGNFRVSREVLIFRDIFLIVIRDYFAGGAGYPIYHERLVRLVDTVSHYLQVSEEAAS